MDIKKEMAKYRWNDNPNYHPVKRYDFELDRMRYFLIIRPQLFNK